MPEAGSGKNADFNNKMRAPFYICMKPIHPAESIKYIILVSITRNRRVKRRILLGAPLA
jgi:hypothetical protein